MAPKQQADRTHKAIPRRCDDGDTGTMRRRRVSRRSFGYQLRRSSARRESAPKRDESAAPAPKTPRTAINESMLL
jgi:hypothetical protein